MRVWIGGVSRVDWRGLGFVGEEFVEGAVDGGVVLDAGGAPPVGDGEDGDGAGGRAGGDAGAGRVPAEAGDGVAEADGVARRGGRGDVPERDAARAVGGREDGGVRGRPARVEHGVGEARERAEDVRGRVRARGGPEAHGPVGGGREEDARDGVVDGVRRRRVERGRDDGPAVRADRARRLARAERAPVRRVREHAPVDAADDERARRVRRYRHRQRLRRPRLHRHVVALERLRQVP